jgi:hypothetical protein
MYVCMYDIIQFSDNIINVNSKTTFLNASDDELLNVDFLTV